MLCQRHRDRRERGVRADTDIRAADFAVDCIGDRAARAFVEQHHYSGSFPASRLNVGLFRRFELVGVAVFSQPMNNAAVPAWTGMDADRGTELGRFVLLDDVAGSGETWFLKRALRSLRAEKPTLETVLSYSDPLEWRDPATGELLKRGHYGTIYQHLGARYRGVSGRRTAYWIGGVPVSGRALSKIRLEERGAEYATAQLIYAGAPARDAGEAPAEWLLRLERLGVLTRTRHPGNHAYVFPLTIAAKLAGRDLDTFPYPRP